MFIERTTSRTLSMLFLLATAGFLGGQPVEGADTSLGIEELYRLDQLAKFRKSTKIGCVSSYDRSGGNDDGFSGKYSFVRKEGDDLVLADLKGPGIIYRIWTPTPTDDWTEFYFDGEDTPRIRIPFRQLFTGESDPFVRPVVGYGAGGFYSYLPIPFEKSCKIVLRAKEFQFYQINFAQYPASAGIKTYSGYKTSEDRSHLKNAQSLFELTGADISHFLAPSGSRVTREPLSARVQAGQPSILWQSSRGGRITGLKLGPASAFAGKNRQAVLRIFWDGDTKPAVLSPVGDLFGYSWGQPAVKSLFLGTQDDTNYLYFPMPFDSSARIELLLEGDAGAPLEVTGEVIFSDQPRQSDEGRFYALWRRENPTVKGEPFTFIKTQGSGHVVGAILQAQGQEPASTRFFEGDDRAIIDGELAVAGTGSEDFFNGGWYNVFGRWISRNSFPLSGCLDYKNALSRTGGYRLMLTDVYSFRESLELTIEHAATENNLVTDYAAVTFLYSKDRPTASFVIPPLADRRVADPEKIIFRPGWNLPIDSFSLQEMTLTKKVQRVDNQMLRYLSVRAKGEDRFGQHVIGFRCEIPERGMYRISMEALKGPEAGVAQIFRQERAEGESVNLQADTLGESGALHLADLEMEEGENVLFFKLKGATETEDSMGLDLLTLIFEKLD